MSTSDDETIGSNPPEQRRPSVVESPHESPTDNPWTGAEFPGPVASNDDGSAPHGVGNAESPLSHDDDGDHISGWGDKDTPNDDDPASHEVEDAPVSPSQNDDISPVSDWGDDDDDSTPLHDRVDNVSPVDEYGNYKPEDPATIARPHSRMSSITSSFSPESSDDEEENEGGEEGEEESGQEGENDNADEAATMVNTPLSEAELQIQRRYLQRAHVAERTRNLIVITRSHSMPSPISEEPSNGNEFIVSDIEVKPAYQRGVLKRRSSVPPPAQSRNLLLERRAAINAVHLQLRERGESTKQLVYVTKEELEERLKDSDAQLAECRINLKETAEACEMAEEEVQAIEMELQRAKQENGEMNERCQFLREKSQKMQKNAQHWSGLLDDLNMDYKALQIANERLQEQIRELEKELEEKEKKCQDLQKRLSKAQAYLECAACSEYEAVIERLEGEVQSLKAKLESFNKTGGQANSEDFSENILALSDCNTRCEKLEEEISNLQSDLDREREVTQALKDQQTFSLALTSLTDGEQWPQEKRNAVAEVIVNHINRKVQTGPPIDIEDVIAVLDSNADMQDILAWLSAEGYEFEVLKLLKELLFSGEALNLGLITAYLMIEESPEGQREGITLRDYINLFETLRREWNSIRDGNGSEKSALVLELESQIFELQEKHSQHEPTIAKLMSRISELETQLENRPLCSVPEHETFVQEIETLKRDLSKCEKEYEECARNFKAAWIKVKEHADKGRELERKLQDTEEDFNAKLVAERQGVKDAMERIATLTRDHADVSQENSRLKNSLKNATTESNNEHGEEVEAAMRKVAEIASDHADVPRENNRLRESLRNANTDTETKLREGVKATMEEIARMASERGDLLHENNRLKDNLKSSENELRQSVEATMRKIARMASDHGDLAHENSRLKECLQNAITDARNLTTQIETMQANQNATASQPQPDPAAAPPAGAPVAPPVVAESSTAATEDDRNLRTQLRTAETAINTLKRRLNILAKSNTTAMASSASASADIPKAQASVKATLVELKDAVSTIKELETALNTLKSENTALKARLARAPKTPPLSSPDPRMNVTPDRRLGLSPDQRMYATPDRRSGLSPDSRIDTPHAPLPSRVPRGRQGRAPPTYLSTGLTDGHLSVPHHIGIRPIRKDEKLQAKLEEYERQCVAEREKKERTRGMSVRDLDVYLRNTYGILPLEPESELWGHVR